MRLSTHSKESFDTLLATKCQKPKNTKPLKGTAGPGTVGKAKKKVPEDVEKAGSEEKKKFRHSENFNYKRNTRIAQSKQSAKKLPFQKKPVLRMLRNFMDEVSEGEPMRITGSARSMALEAARGVVYDVMYGAHNVTLIARKKQTLQVRDIMLYLTSHPDYSKIISIDKMMYNQAHKTGATSLTSPRTYTNLGGDGAQKTAGAVMKIRKGKTGSSKAKVTKKAEAKKTSRKSKKAEAPVADPDATIDPNAPEMAIENGDDAASVEEEGTAMELE